MKSFSPKLCEHKPTSKMFFKAYSSRALICDLAHGQVEDEQRHLGALEDTFQQIKNTTGLAEVDDIIDR